MSLGHHGCWPFSELSRLQDTRGCPTLGHGPLSESVVFRQEWPPHGKSDPSGGLAARNSLGKWGLSKRNNMSSRPWGPGRRAHPGLEPPSSREAVPACAGDLLDKKGPVTPLTLTAALPLCVTNEGQVHTAAPPVDSRSQPSTWAPPGRTPHTGPGAWTTAPRRHWGLPHPLPVCGLRQPHTHQDAASSSQCGSAKPPSQAGKQEEAETES